MSLSGPPDDGFILDRPSVSVRPRWYHIGVLIVCALIMIAIGIGNVIFGAAKGSRFQAFDDVAVPVLGVMLVGCGLALALRRRWTFNAAIAVLVVSILEGLLTFVPSTPGPGEAIFTGLFVAVAYGGPLSLLVWLRSVFNGK